MEGIDKRAKGGDVAGPFAEAASQLNSAANRFAGAKGRLSRVSEAAQAASERISAIYAETDGDPDLIAMLDQFQNTADRMIGVASVIEGRIRAAAARAASGRL